MTLYVLLQVLALTIVIVEPLPLLLVERTESVKKSLILQCVCTPRIMEIDWAELLP